MKLLKYSFLISFTAIVLTACGQKDFTTSPSGLQYRKLVDANGKKPNDGDFLLMNVTYLDPNGNVMFSSAERGGPLPLNYVDSMFKDNGSLEESFKLCNEGDSIELQIPAEIIFRESFRRPLPDTIDSRGKITVLMGVQDVMNMEEFRAFRTKEIERQQAKAQEEAKAKEAEEEEAIQNYLEEHNIEAQKTEDGLYYVITEQGEGPKPALGQKVYVNYTGKLLDGTVFDSSIEEDAKAGGVYNESRDYSEPFSFKIDLGEVIKGWDKGIALLSNGGKATLIIPSRLGYGPRGAGAKIPPYSVLVFDVELVDIK